MYNKISVKNIQKGQILFRASNDTEISNVGADKKLSFDHAALVVDENTIIEATPRYGVRLEPIKEFVKNGNVYLGSSSLVDKELSQKAADVAMKFLGAPYNNTFENSTKKGFYCSQLVEKAFEIANNGKPYFKEDILNFKDNNGKISNFWRMYFKAYNMNVPQGRKGSHPTKLFFDEKIKNRLKVGRSKDLENQMGRY